MFAGATGCYAAMLVVTLIGNVPLNTATLQLSEQASEEELKEIRRRWYRLHVLRVALDLNGMVLAALGVAMLGRSESTLWAQVAHRRRRP